MTKLLYGLAVVPFFASVAMAQPVGSGTTAYQPVQLSEKQMDQVTAGFKLSEIDVSNTSWTRVLAYQTNNNITCGSCYLLINNFALSVGSKFGPTPP